VRDSPLIEARELALRLGDPRWVIVDCRFELLQPAAGRAAYDRSHIPGARYADLDRDLARRPGPGDGRHPLPDVAVFVERLGQWGIGNESTVVAYDDSGGAIAARLWWMLRWLGHPRTSVLNGGFTAWQAAGLPVETEPPIWRASQYHAAAVAEHAVVSSGELPALQDGGGVVVDARAAARYRGEHEPIDPVAGHVPGARNWPFAQSLTAAGKFRDAGELRRDLTAFLGRREPQQVIAMCGSGVTACHFLLAMAVAGLGDGRLYAGSWSEWIRDPARAVRTGPAP
jgi:thiosulfate/3-mercaptopyruvate sulfurtransferase